MMELESAKIGKILQELVDLLISIKVSLPHFVGLAHELTDSCERYHLKLCFDHETGELVEVETIKTSPLSDEAFYIEMVEDFKSGCFQYCEILQKELPQFFEEWCALDRSLGQLPENIHRELSGVRIGCRSWRAYVRKYVILPLERWPSNRRAIPRRAYEKEVRAPLFPQRVNEFLACMDQFDPADYWDRVLLKISSFVEDVRVAALELNSQINTIPDGPAAGRYWSWKGKVTKKPLTEKPFQLACRLWESKGLRISIRTLTGMGEIFEGVQEESVKKQGRMLSDFFLNEGIPVIVESGGGQISMLINDESTSAD